MAITAGGSTSTGPASSRSTPISRNLLCPARLRPHTAADQAVRILFVSGFFPPKAPMGAIRTGSLAAYWQQSGHDVRVIAVALPQQDWAHEEDAGIPVHYIPYSEPGRIVTKLVSAVRKARNRSEEHTSE